MPSDQSAVLEVGAKSGLFRAMPFASSAATRQRLRLASLLVADVIAAVLSFGLAEWALWLMAARMPWLQDFRWHVWTPAVILAVLLGYLANTGHYTRRIPFWIELRELLVGCAAAFLASCLLTDGGDHLADKIAVLLLWVTFFTTVLCLRAATRMMLSQFGMWVLETLVVGEPAAAARVVAALDSQPSLGYRVVDRVAPGALRIGAGSQALRNLLAHSGAEFLVLAGRAGDSVDEARLIAALDRLRIPFGVVSEVETLPVRRSQEHYFIGHDVTFLTFNNNHDRPFAQLMKRALDVGLAGTLLLMIAPFMLCLALLIRRDGGPVLFRQRRIGRNGERYACLKFRTMRVDADQVLQDLLINNPAVAAEWALRQKLAHDPRITALGHILRKTSLDELPQLINIVRGEMSLVGPRPIVPSEVSRYGDHIAYYYETRPGLTGLWQVSGRSETSYDRRVQLDVWYVRNWSVWHDIIIMLKTIPALLLRRGAV